MPPARLFAATTLAMVAFAGNSLLCRLALNHTRIDAASFTSIRLVSGALALWLIVRLANPAQPGRGNWPSALALFAYAMAFSLAYVQLSAATGALLLFGAVQATMVAQGLRSGERMRFGQWTGFVLALAGLGALLLPGLAAPPLGSAALMVGAGLAWGVYSLRGKSAGNPTRVTAGNFMRAAPMALAASLLAAGWPGSGSPSLDGPGMVYALASGALASGMGYAVWYMALPSLNATHSATVQLSVPVIAALGGILLLDENLSWRLVMASVAILGGIALVILDKGPSTPQ